MTKHYEFTEEVKNDTFYRIRSLVDMPEYSVKAGDIGGWMTKDSELGENSWVMDDAMVESSSIEGHVIVSDNASVRKSKVKGYSSIKGFSDIFESEVTSVQMSGDGTIHSSTIETDSEFQYTTILGESSMSHCRVSLGNQAKPYGLSLTGDSRMRGTSIRGANIKIHENTDVFNSTINGIGIHIERTDAIRVCKIEGNDIAIKDCRKLNHSEIKGNQIALKNNNEIFKLKMAGDSNELCFIGKGHDIQITGSNVLLSYADVKSSVFSDSQTIRGVSLKKLVTIIDSQFELPNTFIQGENQIRHCSFGEGYKEKVKKNQHTLSIKGENRFRHVEISTIKSVQILGKNSLEELLIEGEALIKGENKLEEMYIRDNGNRIEGACRVDNTSLEGNNNQIMGCAIVSNDVKGGERIELSGSVTINEFAGVFSKERIQLQNFTLSGDAIYTNKT